MYPIPRSPRRSSSLRPASLLLACGLLACSGTDEDASSFRAAADEAPEATDSGESKPVESLPTLGADEAVDTFVQLLPEPTVHGENVAVHMKLPPPRNPELAGSLVRIFGSEQSPILVFRSDALVELGVISQSPGEGFFTTFVQLDPVELEKRLETESILAGSEDATESTIIFRGRTPFAITTGIPFDIDLFNGGGIVALGPCPMMPASQLARWEESLLITNPVVVQDPSRTHDFCGAGGDPNGVWTFKHLMEEMATGSGMSTHDFVVDWLSNWLNDHPVNNDTIPARTQMFNQVIQPWANQSGVSASLMSMGGTNVLSLSGPLDLDISPFRLSAIVNRIDLGDTATGGGGGYGGGGTTTEPADAGELRFIFGVQDIDTCQQLPFSVIFEYGVPIEGCEDVRDWAIKWTELNDAALLPPFSPPWLAHLEGLTQSVVVHGAAPGKGNDNAINQIRTNEIALASPWELREFTLSTEDLTSTDPDPTTAPPDTPASGPLLPHTVAMTPNDTAFAPPAPSPEVDDFVTSFVIPSVSGTGLPGDCGTSYVVPADHPNLAFHVLPTNGNFRGGNSFTAPPTHWEANIGTSAQEVCGRHQFSLNTCNGCHFGDTSTPFFHVDPTVMPATLSNFLTGGAFGVWSVPDTQFGTPSWDFADLDRRFHRLYEIACAECGTSFTVAPSIFETIADLSGFVPLDVVPGTEPPVPVGPILSLEQMAQLLELRNEMVIPEGGANVALGELVRPVETFVH